MRRTLACVCRRAAASASPLATPRLLLLARRALRRTQLLLLLLLLLRALFLLLLRRTRSLLRLLRTRSALLARRLLFARTRALAGALFELAHLLLHVPLCLALLFEARVVVPAIRATSPSLGISLLAGAAKDAFRERHREIGAHCTLRTVDEPRRRTLETLLQLAGESSQNTCWDDARAVDLLRRQATREELEELGADERLLAYIYPERHG
ncbi:MAG TPA: hypothetical protein VM733_19945 [Thermoanaerobaculia bacterium]|nr:hypothetical protein [Thermoanaerobaculia bacterium]